MRVEQLVVVGAGRLLGEVGQDRGVRIRRPGRPAASPGCCPCPAGSDRRCARCPSGTACRSGGRSPGPGPGRRCCPRRIVPSLEDVLRQTAGSGPGMKLPYGSVASIGMSITSLSTRWRPSFVSACVLHGRPRRHAGRAVAGAAEQLAGVDRMVGAVEVVLAQEDLVRRMRRVGLALVDPGRVRVRRVLDVVGALVASGGNVERRARNRSTGVRRRAVAEDAVGTGLVLGAGQHHERLVRRDLVAVARDAVRAGRDQRIVRLERDEDGGAALARSGRRRGRRTDRRT